MFSPRVASTPAKGAKGKKVHHGDQRPRHGGNLDKIRK
jgi:hypothetical protein